jgi:2-methylisocitrate lyase-like PEP mutase family enzyme
MTPCVYDPVSAWACELAGYEAILLSGGELGESFGNIFEPLITVDELVLATKRICDFSTLPLVVDMGPVASFTVLAYHRACQRLVEAGAMALAVEEDSAGGTTREDYMAKMRAALDAAKASRCVVIARSDIWLDTPEHVDEVVARMTQAMDLGAYMAMVCGLTNAKDAEMIATRVPGLKFYPDTRTRNGIPEVDNNHIYELGYKMVSFHFAIVAALDAMVGFGKRILEAENTGPFDEYIWGDNTNRNVKMPVWNIREWLALEARFTGLKRGIPMADAEDIF